MGWWEDPEDNVKVPDTTKDEVQLSYVQQYCDHKWKCTVLIISSVYDCTKCDIKKEDFEKWQKTRK